MDKFRAHVDSLQTIDKELLGDVSQKRILHLQCHFGQDSLSLANKGALVTGVDFSLKAIETAQSLSEELSLSADFICEDVLQLDLDTKFDIVYTSYGVINWLPNLNKWAKVIRKHLKPNGRFIMVEFHPFLNVFDDEWEGIGHNYCQKEKKPVEFKDQHPYVDYEAKGELYTTYEYLHPLSDVLNALARAKIDYILKEYPYSNFNCFPNLFETDKGMFRHKYEIPMMFSIDGVVR